MSACPSNERWKRLRTKGINNTPEKMALQVYVNNKRLTEPLKLLCGIATYVMCQNWIMIPEKRNGNVTASKGGKGNNCMANIQQK